MSLATPDSIRKLQRKLYLKAKDEPAFRFYLLYDKICREDILRHAYDLARANKGAPGVDGVTFATIEAAGREEWLAAIRKDLVAKTYRPQPGRRGTIPKPGGGERALGIPTIRGRVVQTAAKLVLEPIFEADLDPAAFGYRPKPGLFGAGHEAFVRAGIGDWRIVAARAPLTGTNRRAGAAMVPFAGLLAALEGIPDPRRRQGRRYPLAPLLLFSVLAVLAGATSYRGILTFIGVHRERLNAVFGARFRRAPAVNTLRGLFLALEPAELGAGLEAACREHARALADRAPARGRVVALDGKTLRRSFDHLNDEAAAHVLSAFAGEAALILAHQEITEGDEVAAARALIERLGLSGVLFTADALHCQKTFACATATGNALLVRVKAHQPRLRDALVALCAEREPSDRLETVDRGRHGRHEHRRVEVFEVDGRLAPDRPAAAGPPAPRGGGG